MRREPFECHPVKAGILVLSFFAAAQPAFAEIVAKEFVQSGTGKVASGYVLQGSRNMKHLGKGRGISGVPVPKMTTLSPIPVPTVEAAQAPFPRFGFGSNCQPGEATHPHAMIPPFLPVYQRTQYYPYPGAFASCYYFPSTHYFRPFETYPGYRFFSYFGGTRLSVSYRGLSSGYFGGR